MPKATANPSSVRNVAGMVARAAKVPVRTKPGGGDHPFGRGEPGDRAVPGAAFVGFFADPGHQEDVVLGAERDQEHVPEQRHGGVSAAEAEHTGEEEGTDAQCPSDQGTLGPPPNEPGQLTAQPARRPPRTHLPICIPR
jgi:hypothetical protein